MARLGVEDDMPIEAGMVNKAVENAQTKVEGHNFDIRKHVLRYDEVVNEQRHGIYEQRHRILFEPSLKTSIEAMIEEEVTVIVNSFTTSGYEDEWQIEELIQALSGIFHIPPEVTVESWEKLDQQQITEEAVRLALETYAAKDEEIGDEKMRQTEKQIMLSAVDYRWVRHLTDLDRLREGIGLQAIAQVDPLVAYKREAFVMYGELMESIRSDIVKAVLSIHVQAQPVEAAPIARNIRTNQGASNGAPAKPQTMRKTGPDLKRNDPCWCGSGKKYKSCHMKSDRVQAGGGEQRVKEPS
jgi:preprotein translocase subunit SecA